MRHLMQKELKLAMHPAAIMFIALSALLIIPNYPYYVTYFYTSLGIFFICLSGRDNHDIFYSMTLPVSRADIVKSRMLTALLLETLQTLAAIPFALIRCRIIGLPNLVGIDANAAFFGSAFVMLGIFNFVFFTNYYRNPDKVGKCFAIAATVEGVYLCVAETLVHAVPFARDVLDTPVGNTLPKLIVLFVGIAVYAVMFAVTLRVSVKRFGAVDL